MIRYGPHVLIALAGLVLQSTLFSRLSADTIKPDLALLIVIHLGLHRPTLDATPPVLAMGFLADHFSALPNGTFLLLYLAFFYLAAGSARIFYFSGTGFPSLVVFALTLLFGVAATLMVGYGRAVDESDPSPAIPIRWAFLGLIATVNVLFSMPLFRFCRAIESGRDLHLDRRLSL